MKQIIIKRDQEKVNKLVDYKVVIGDTLTISIGNGETKKVFIDKTPIKAYAKLTWIKSKAVTINANTTELHLTAEKVKNWFAVKMGAFFILISSIPRLILDESPIAKNISIVGLSILLLWTIYAFIIKSDDWIIIKTRESD